MTTPSLPRTTSPARRISKRWLFLLPVIGSTAWLLAPWIACQIESHRPLVRQQDAAQNASFAASPGTTPTTDVMKDDGAWQFERVNAARQVLETGTDEEAIESIRQLAALESWASVNTLSTLAGDSRWPEDARIEAIQALGVINTSASARALKDLLGKVGDVPLQIEIVAALGNQPYYDIAQPFESILRSQSAPSDLRVAVAEALARSTPEALPTLHGLTATDGDADVRAAAAWAMSCIRTEQPYGKELATLVGKEPETMVRRRLYEALLVQKENTALSITTNIQKESDVAARVAGLNALGDAVGRAMDPDLSTAFDTRQVPELTRIALSEETLNLRMRAVFALRRAATPAAMQALTQISQTSPTPQVSRAAYNGAKPVSF